jgi:hypothetical protein
MTEGEEIRQPPESPTVPPTPEPERDPPPDPVQDPIPPADPVEEPVPAPVETPDPDPPPEQDNPAEGCRQRLEGEDHRAGDPRDDAVDAERRQPVGLEEAQ